MSLNVWEALCSDKAVIVQDALETALQSVWIAGAQLLSVASAYWQRRMN